jgi:hypothetical protein
MAAVACVLAGCASAAKPERVPAVPTPIGRPPADARAVAVLPTSSDLGPGWSASAPATAPLTACAEGAVGGATNIWHDHELMLERAFVFPTESAAEKFYADWTSGKCFDDSSGVTHTLKIPQVGDQSTAYRHQSLLPPSNTRAYDHMTIREENVVMTLVAMAGIEDEFGLVAAAAARAARRSPPSP